MHSKKFRSAKSFCFCFIFYIFLFLKNRCIDGTCMGLPLEMEFDEVGTGECAQKILPPTGKFFSELFLKQLFSILLEQKVFWNLFYKFIGFLIFKNSKVMVSRVSFLISETMPFPPRSRLRGIRITYFFKTIKKRIWTFKINFFNVWINFFTF